MADTNNKNNDIIEIDLKRLWTAVWSRLWMVIIATILCAAIALVITVYLITPLYQSSAMFYVNNSALSVGDTSLSIDSGDITASKNLVDTYIVILNSRSCLNDVIDYAELNYSVSELEDMISAASVNQTEVFEVVITGPDAKENEKIANAIAYILPNKISDIVEGTSAKVVDYAIVAVNPSSPNRMTNTLVGGLLGFVAMVGLIVLLEIFDNTIRSEEDVVQLTKHPILAAVPDMAAHSKGGYYYDGYVKKKSKKKKALSENNGNTENSNTQNNANPNGPVVVVGDNISFAATEAYKLLRTKVEFSFADGDHCRILGVSSALAGEGKSLSSINLAYSLSQLDKKVLLIDCDMRRPSLATKINLQRVPGLSNYLTGRNALEDIVQLSGEQFSASAFHIIASGRIPPNPIELLSSKKMEELLSDLRKHYDYIILDLPPVGEVSDAIVAAKLVDGVLMVACQNYCTRSAFSHAVDQFEFVESRILGIVLNRVTESSRRYGYKYGYRYGYRYRRRYYKGYYGYGYSQKEE